MPIIQVKLPHHCYDICIESGLLQKTGKLAKKYQLEGRTFVITSPRIRRYHGQILEQALHSGGSVPEWLMVPEGEQSKCLMHVERLYSHLIKGRADRASLILAFGGGMIGDLAGFVAATYLRGIRLVQIPTTLLSQIDSSIGGKVGVNHPLGKNLIGAFYQPHLVLTDPRCLQTLARRELRSGLMEAVKYGVIANPELFAFLEKSVPRLLACDSTAVLRLVRDCSTIKAKVVSEDERESGLRMILNFGHTLGHALEAVTDYRRFKHGEAVGWGMVFAAQWAADLGHLDYAEAKRIVQLIRAFGLPLLPRLSSTEITTAMDKDKKRARGSLRWVLPQKIGQVLPFTTDDISGLQQALIRHGIAC